MKIAIGSDHRGFAHKAALLAQHSLAGTHVSWHDMGCFTAEDADYPEFAQYVVHAVASGQAELGILLCGTGGGMAIAANRFSHIYATVAWNEEVARLGREHDNTNILVLPADYVTSEQALKIVGAWLGARFAGERHAHRLAMIDVMSMPEDDGCGTGSCG
jgi:ribose 5-phosphate isomerase B